MRIQLQPAYLLHRRPYRDSSDLLELLTLEFGRIGAVARGLGRRRSGGALASILQPFRPLFVSLSGKGELLSLTAAEPGGAVEGLRADALFSGFYLNELLLRTLQRHDPHPQIFAAYAEAVAGLAADPGRSALAHCLRRFEFALIEDLGYAVDFTHLADGSGAIEPQRSYHLVPGEGLFEVPAAGQGASTYSGEDLCAIAAGELDEISPSVLRRLAQELLADHVGSEPLRSPEVYRKVLAGTP
ncbi:MAG: DNA repair protein RecO [Pseudomonadota bacterium]